jgi:hypothetical protein
MLQIKKCSHLILICNLSRVIISDPGCVNSASVDTEGIYETNFCKYGLFLPEIELARGKLLQDWELSGEGNTVIIVLHLLNAMTITVLLFITALVKQYYSL